MPLYRYQAVSATGETLEGEMRSQDAAQVIRHLQERGYVPLSAEPAIAPVATPARHRFGLRGKAGANEVLKITRALAALTGAGTTLDRAFAIMDSVEQDPRVGGIVAKLHAAVRGGAALSDAVAAHGAPFSKFYVSILRASEAGGDLGTGLARLVDYLESRQALRGRVLSALIYPTILLCVAGLSMAVLLTWVVPQFRTMFDDMGAALPLATQVVLAVSDALARFGWLILLALLLALHMARRYLSKPERRYKLDAALIRVPVLGALVRSLETTHLCRSLGTLMQNGVPLLNALEIARGSLGNLAVIAAVSKASEGLKQGGRLDETLAQAQVFPPLAIQLVCVGEETGRLDAMLLKIAEVYDREVNVSMQRLLSLLEPALILVLGISIAAIIMSILVGIISVNELPM